LTKKTRQEKNSRTLDASVQPVFTVSTVVVFPTFK
jgi:hypothetical protein